MGTFASVVRMVAQRSLGHWRLFAAMVAGAILCGALMACVVLYSDAVRDLGLKYALESRPRFANDVQVISTSQRFNATEYSRLRSVTDNAIDQTMEPLATGRVHYGRSATFFPTAPGEAVAKDESRPRAHFQFADNLSEKVRIVDGEAPATGSTTGGEAAPAVEVWLSKQAADALSVKTGDRFDLHPHWRAVEPIKVTVAGLIEPLDINDPYWFGKTDRFVVESANWKTLPFFIDEGTLINAIGGYLLDMDGSLETYVPIDISRITSSNARETEGRVGALKATVQSQLTISRAETSLDSTIADYREKLFFTRLPLFALMIQIVGIVLFYLVMVSTMVIERQAGEIALLKSRGAGTFQVLAVFVIEGAGIALLATVLGPLVAAGAISVLGLTPSFEALSGGELLDVPFSLLSVLMAAGGGLLAMAALVWPAYRACRYSITNYKQQISRPPRQPAFLRYYLDLVLVAGAAFAFYQLRQRGSFVTEGLFGDLSADPILLATPSLFMLMVALVFLRLFPLGLKLVLWATRMLKGPTVALGLTRMARSPLQHSRLILLLLLATAVGMFAAGFRSTLERGYEDRAAYKAGGHAGRLGDTRQPSALPAKEFEEALARGLGGGDPMAAIRVSAYYNATRFQSEGLQILGVDLERFPEVAAWRDDFASRSLRGLMDQLRLEPATNLPEPIKIPGDARFIGVWALPQLNQTFMPLGLRLRDNTGGIWEFRLVTEGQPQPDTWQFFVADLSRPTGTRPGGAQPSAAARGWVFDAFFVLLPGAPPQVSQQINLPLDDLQVSSQATVVAGFSKTGFSSPTILDTFDTIERYELVKGVTQSGDPGVLARAPAPAGREGSVARLTFTRGRGAAPVIAFRTVRDSRPLPVVVSKPFLDKQKRKVGDEFAVYVNSQYVNVKVVGDFDLFPTYDPKKPDGLFIADLETLRQNATRIPGAGSNVYANEAWLASRPTVDLSKATINEKGIQAEGIFDRVKILEEQSSDPLVAASWEGILFLAFAGVLIVSALGFVTYSGLGAQARSLEFAILRTMGLSSRQILGVVTFEQLFVVVAGIAAGTLLGFPLSSLMISYMGLTENGAEPLPPLLSIVNWQSVVTVYILLGLVVVSTVVTLVALYSRLAVSRALRMGEL